MMALKSNQKKEDCSQKIRIYEPVSSLDLMLVMVCFSENTSGAWGTIRGSLTNRPCSSGLSEKFIIDNELN